ncbi:MAG: hypothetical protein EBR82_61390 [Caulobacteraceae bacterium]|nr:hypothetical protein [Caulobacteraceae bacterium]
MNGRNFGLVAVACVGLLCGGCAHECKVAYHAATALDAACASAGLATSDPELLLVCASQALSTKRALKSGKCAAETSGLYP